MPGRMTAKLADTSGLKHESGHSDEGSGCMSTEFASVLCKSLAQAPLTIAMSLGATLFMVLGPNLQAGFATSLYNSIFDALYIMCSVIFVYIMCLSLVGFANYWTSISFCIDILSTLSSLMQLSSVSVTLVSSSRALRASGSPSYTAEAVAINTLRLVCVMRLVYLLQRLGVYQRMRSFGYVVFRRTRSTLRRWNRYMLEWMYSWRHRRPNRPRAGSDLSVSDDDFDEQKRVSDDVQEALMSGLFMAPTEKRSEGVDKHVTKRKLAERTMLKSFIVAFFVYLGLPFFQAAYVYRVTDSSLDWGLDNIHESYRRYLDSSCDTSMRVAYESAVLLYVFRFNYWIQFEGCPNGYDDGASSRPTVSGYTGADSLSTSHCLASSLATFLISLSFQKTTNFQSSCTSNQQAPNLWAYLQRAQDAGVSVYTYINTRFGSLGDVKYNYGYLPSNVIDALTSTWSSSVSSSCSSVYASGLPIQSSYTVQVWNPGSSACPTDSLLALDTYVSSSRFVPSSSFYAGGTSSTRNGFVFTAAFDATSFAQQYFVWTLLQHMVVFVVVFGLAGALVDVCGRLLMAPLDKMIRQLDAIKSNPLVARDMAYDLAASKRAGRLAVSRRCAEAHYRLSRLYWEHKIEAFDSHELVETRLLEQSFASVGSLMCVGLGTAGTELVAKNMAQSDGSSISALVPGRRVEAVFVVCRVENFGALTAVLQGQVIMLLNSIAEIVHGVVDEFHGIVNRTSHDGSFLLVWPIDRLKRELFAEHFPDDETRTGQIDTNGEIRKRIVDLAFTAVVKAALALAKSPELREFAMHPKLQQSMAGFLVSLRFAGHYGFAIEGAIGSEFKVDASYLGSDVNMCFELSDLSDKYQVGFMFSGQFAAAGSKYLRRTLRRIDIVKTKALRAAAEVWTLDLDLSTVAAEAGRCVLDDVKGFLEDEDQERSRRLRRKQEKCHVSAETILSEDDDFWIGRHALPHYPEFVSVFQQGLVNYEAGEWEIAKDALERAGGLLSDGPTTALLHFMRKYEFAAPKGWRGYRDSILI